MLTLKYDSREAWLEGRRGKITGSRLKDIVSTVGIPKEVLVQELKNLNIEFKKGAKKEDLEALLPPDVIAKLEKSTPRKIGFYELIAERLGIPADDENSRDRGTRLECEAIEMFEKETGLKVDTSLVIWAREDNESIAISPDGFIGKTKAVEAKCLASARHIEAFLTQRIPDEYGLQMLQYFIVNDKLETLYFAFYDPRLLAKPFFVIEVKRKDVAEAVTEYLDYEQKILEEVDEAVNNLTY